MVHGALLRGRHADVPRALAPSSAAAPASGPLDRACAGLWARPSPVHQPGVRVHAPGGGKTYLPAIQSP